MNIKNIEFVAAPPAPHMVGDGFRVHNFIPGIPRMSMQRMDPFIMLDYNSKFYFSVTVAYKGKVAHHDSSGNSGVIGEGDVQWMTAASGILHKEYHEENFARKGGDFQMVQLWVNLPAEAKKTKPKYQEIAHEKVNKFQLADDGGTIEVIAGQYKDVKGTASTFTPINLYNVRLKKGAKTSLSFPAKFNTVLLVIEGSIKVNDQESVYGDNIALFKNEGEDFTIEALEDAVVLVLSGEPIGEPIASHGPFVMNTKEELREAFDEFNSGKFGVLKN
jgi:redox-sensitive bicupin YhaK (pirin superfamily)